MKNGENGVPSKKHKAQFWLFLVCFDGDKIKEKKTL